MISVGIDLVEIERIKKSMKNPRFLKKVLGKNEYIQLENRGFPPQSVAASFAAKEAFSKAVGTGLSGFELGNVELLRKDSGEPFLNLNGKALNIKNEKSQEFSVSVTHTKLYAAAVVVGEKTNNSSI